MARDGSVADRLSLGASKVVSESLSVSGEVLVVVGVGAMEVEVVVVVDSGIGLAEEEQCKVVVLVAVAMGIVDLGKYRAELGLTEKALRGVTRRSEVAIGTGELGDWDNAKPNWR